MKRDMDLVRAILIQVEESDEADGDGRVEINSTEHSPRVIFYHVRLLEQAGLIGIDEGSMCDEGADHPSGLTWKGHEFLDAIRKDSVWEKVKVAAIAKTGSASFDLVRFLAVKYGRLAIKSITGDLG